MPPLLLATLITPLHLSPRPIQAYTPLLFPPILLFTSYMNLAGYKRDAAGFSAAWSGLYMLLAARRRNPGAFYKRFGARGLIRGAAMGLAAVNVVTGGLAFATGEKGRAAKWIGKDESEEA